MRRARALLLVDGSSDEPLGRHAAALARKHGVVLDVVAPEFERMARPPGRRIADRIQRVLAFDPDFEVVLIHRDAEAQPVEHRVAEIHLAVEELSFDCVCVPVVPIRMTEAWLLLDETAIRWVAGRPSGREPLQLPKPDSVESHPDPKALLREALNTASGFSGRRLRKFDRDFGSHRRQLMERLDRRGPVQSLGAWQALELSIRRMSDELRDRDAASG